MELEEVTEENILALMSVVQKIWREHFPAIIGSEMTEYMLKTYQSQATIEDQIQHQGLSYFFIRVDAQKAGYLAYCLEAEELFLSKLYVAQEFRGQGIARSCLAVLEEIAKTQGRFRIKLYCNKENTDSLAAYAKLGFKVTGEAYAELDEGMVMDDYILEKALEMRLK